MVRTVREEKKKERETEIEGNRGRERELNDGEVERARNVKGTIKDSDTKLTK